MIVVSVPNRHVRLFEVTPNKEIVWEYVLPAMPRGGRPDCGSRRGGRGPGGPGGSGTSIFRVTRYAKDFPGFKDKNLNPIESLAEAIKRERPTMRGPR